MKNKKMKKQITVQLRLLGELNAVMSSLDVTMISTGAEGIPNSEAFSSKHQTTASRVSSRFGHFMPSGNWGRVEPSAH